MISITVLGSFSGRNKGDLAILRAQLGEIERRLKDELRICLFTKDPGRMREYLGDIIEDKRGGRKLSLEIYKAITAYFGPKSLGVLGGCEKVVFGGGGLFFDTMLFNIGISQLLNLFLITPLLKLMGKDFMIFAAGCSNLHSGPACFMARSVLKKAKVVTVRDQLSHDMLNKCASMEMPIGADPALLLKPMKTKRADAVMQSWPSSKKILLCLHKFLFVATEVADSEDALKKFIDCLSEYAFENGYTVLTYTNHTNQGLAQKLAESGAENVIPALAGENHLLPEEILYLFGNVDLVVASPMHACMFAYLAGVPFVSMPYAQKVEEFNYLVDNKNVLAVKEIANCQKVQDCLENAVAAGALAVDDELLKKASGLFDVLMDFING